MRRGLMAGVVLALGMTSAQVALAEPTAPVLEAPVEVTVGDAIPAILEVTVPSGDDVAVPDQSFEPFEVLAKKTSVEASADGLTSTFTFELTLQCFDVGAHQLGPIRVRVAGPDGDLTYLESNVRSVDVLSLLANEPSPELKPPTAPVVVEQDDYTLLVIAGALAAMALGALLGWLGIRWWQNRDRPPPPLPEPRPPWEIAFRELSALERVRAEAIESGGTERWVDAVSDSVRQYLGQRYGFHGLESTTDEITVALRHASELPIEPHEATAFLGQCDLVKFAKASLANEASERLIAQAFSLVERTRPVERNPSVANA